MATPTSYQRVNTATDYDTTAHSTYLRFDGSDDYMLTNSIDFGAGATNAPLGSNLVTNGDFSDGTTGWAARPEATISNVSGELFVQVTTSAAGTGATQELVLTVGKIYKITGTIRRDIQADFVQLAVTNNAVTAFVAQGKQVTSTTNENVVLYFTATETNNQLYLRASKPAGGTYNGGYFDNITVQELLDDRYAPDKMTVFAGVRKLSDAAQGIIAEISASAASNVGAFNLQARGASAPSLYVFASKGSATLVQAFATDLAYTAPTTNVLSGIGDISGDVTTVRVNGTQAGTSSTDQGTGTYGNYPLNIGRRNGSSLPFNGRLYELIVRGAESTESEITNTETWVNNKTKAY